MIRSFARMLALLVCLLFTIEQTVQAQTVTYYYTDPQGTPLAEADSQGQVIRTMDYTPGGRLVMATPADGPGYTGHVSDTESDLVYMQARYYDPDVSRFLSVDPLAPDAGNLFRANRFAYANNNPVRYTDPDGRCADGCIIEAPLIVGTGAVYVVASELVVIGVCVATCTKIKNGIETAAGAAADKIGGLFHSNDAAPDLPTDLVGESPRATGKNGGTAIGTSLPGGKFADTVKDLTGDSLGQPDAKGRSVSPNGVSVRTGGKDGPRIDIPANGKKPPEIIHFPQDTPIPPDLLKATP